MTPGSRMDQANLNWIANFIWGFADDVLRDLYVRGKYRDVILPMTVLRRLGGQDEVQPETKRPQPAGPSDRASEPPRSGSLTTG